MSTKLPFYAVYSNKKGAMKVEIETTLTLWGLQHVMAQRAFEVAQNLPPLNPQLTVTSTAISDELLDRFLKIWPETPYVEYDPENYDTTYQSAGSDHDVAIWNRYIPHLHFSAPMLDLISELCNELRDFTQMALGHFVSFVNVRIYECRPGIKEDYFRWHSDVFPRPIKKIMVFLTPPSHEFGTMEIEVEGRRTLLEGMAGAAFLFDNNLTHRAVAPQGSRPRLAIELTVAPSVYPDPVVRVAGTAANFPSLPLDAYEYFDQLHDSGFGISFVNENKGSLEKQLADFYAQRERDANVTPDKLNIGGGPHFYHSGWINLDGAFGIANLYPFKFHERCHFPIEHESIKQIYSCHTFEHFDEQTLSRVLRETHRVMAADGEFLIKIPDYDLLFDLYEECDIEALKRLTLIQKVSQYISAVDIDINCETVLSFSMCNYWNSAYGADLYQKSTITNTQGAYFGPAKIRDPELLKNIFTSRSPYKISHALRSFVVTTEQDYIWGHQLAFSFLEFKEFLERHGFAVMSNDKQEIIRHCASWPEIEWLEDRSMFVLLKKQSSSVPNTP